MAEGFKKVDGIRGMNDLLPDTSYQWEALEALLQEWLALYGYRNMRVPILEHTRLFTRGIGEVTDIVEKEMYTFTDALNGDSLTLRPEFTAGIVRSTIQNNLLYERPQRIYSIGPVFRHERPQRGRYRQFHQLDVEGLGFAGPDIDAEMILMTARLWRMLDLKDVNLELNSLGQLSERLAHREALIAHLEKHRDVLDADGLRRMHTNPLRVLDTKNPDMQEMADTAPKLFDFLGDESRAHFDRLRQYLDDAGIEYRINPRMVRGLDYYNLTVFEWVTGSLGAQATICGGGRYDDLIDLLGGKPAPAIGFAIGLERLVDLWLQTNDVQEPAQCDVYVVHMGDAAALFAVELGEKLRNANIRVIVHAGSGSFRSQMRRADHSRASIAVILGDSEMQSKQAGVKVLRENGEAVQGDQADVSFDDLVAYLQNAKK